jgi:hypothetical protein
MGKLHPFALCLKNRGYPGALEVRKVYPALSDPSAEKRGLVRVIDESGEDYLYPAAFFVAIEVPRKALGMFSKKRT